MIQNVLKNLTLILFLVAITYSINGQKIDKDTAHYPYWVEMMEDPTSNYFETVRAFNLYWENREITKGCGYKPFLRWAYDAQTRIKPDGTLESPLVDYNAFKTWQKEQAAKLDIIIKPGTGGSVGACPKDGYWEELGPILYPRNATGQPTGMGRLNAIAFHPSDSNIIYAGAPAGGLWKTTDRGVTWKGLTDDMATLGVSAIHINPNSPNTIIIGTGDRDASNSTGLGVFKSTNGGSSFTQMNTGMGNQTVCKIVVDPSNQNKIVAATKGGLYRTTNGGANWSKVNSKTNFREIDFKPGDFSTLYASRSGEFYRSTDSGKTFTEITSGLPSTDIYRGVIGVSADNSSIVYYVVTEQRKFIGLYKSTNSGLTFSTQSTTPNIMGYQSNGSDAGGQAFYDLDIAVNPDDVDEIYVGGINIFKSSNGGVNWAIDAHWTGDGGKGEIHADNHILKFDPINYNLFVGNDGGFYKRNDWDGEWKEFSSTLAIGQVYRVSAAQTKPNFVVNGYQDNGMSYYEGKGSFVTFRGGDGVDNAVDPTNADYYYGSYVNGVITRHGFGSDGDIGKNGLNGIDETGAWVSPYVLREGVPGTMIAGFKNIWICTNLKTADKDDISWTKISSGLASEDDENMHKVENSPADNKILYASRADNTLFRTDNLTASTVSWTDLTSSLPNSNSRVEDIESDFSNANVVYIIQNKKVYKSTNKGSSWTNMSTGLPNITFYDLILDSSKTDGSIYAAGYAGVYYKNDNLSSWQSYYNNLPANVPVRDLEISYNTDPSEYRLIAATYGRGTWQTQLYDNGVNKPEAEIDGNSEAICKGKEATYYNTSDYYPGKICWVVTPNTGVTFTNGTSASSMDKISLSFANAGSYEVKLVVENCNGKDSIVKSVNVYDAPKAASCNTTTTNLNNNAGVGIKYIKISGLENSSNTSVSGGANEDFTCLKILELDENTSYNVNVTTGVSNNESVSIYIDYNNDGSFSSTERVFTNSGAKTHSGSFTTPTNAVTGKALRLRVISKFGSLPTGPCQSFTYGQSEDYSVAIKGDKADFTADKASACKSETIVFTDASTATGTYAWDFGAGASPATASTKGPHSVTYSTIGNKTVKLTVAGTLIEEKTNFITINETPSVTASITKGSSTNCVGEEVILMATDSKGVSTAYEWYLGSTKLSETSNTLTISSFSSTNNGSYTVKGINGNCTNTSSAINLTASDVVTADFSVNSSKQCLTNNSFVITNNSSSSSYDYDWEFSNNTTSILKAPTVNFLSAGSYTAKLIASSYDGCKDTITKTLIVDPEVDASFSFTNPDKNTFNFSPTVTTYSSYNWDFDNGAGNSTNKNPSYDFVDLGDYDVTLIVQDETCKDTISKTVNAQFNSISNIEGFSALFVSPNPSNGKINLSFNLEEAKELAFDLYDINGRLVSKLQNPKLFAGTQNINFDLHKIGISQGTYFLHIISKEGTNTIKLIIK